MLNDTPPRVAVICAIITSSARAMPPKINGRKLGAMILREMATTVLIDSDLSDSACGEGPLDVGFFEVARGEAGFRVNTGDAHEVSVGADSADVFNRRSTDCDDGVFE